MRYWFLGVLCVLAQSVAADDLDSEYAKLVDRYVAATEGGFQMYAQDYAAGLARQLVQMKPLLPAEAEDVVHDVIAAVVSEWFSDSAELSTVYERLFAESLSLEQLRDVVRFYESDTGKRLVTLQGAAYKEAESEQILFLLERHVSIELGPRLNAAMKARGW